MSPFRHLLVPTDFSACSTHAVDVAVQLATTLEADLTLVHVWQLPTPLYGDAFYLSVDVATSLTEAAQQTLDEALAKVRAKYPRAKGILRQGVAWREILGAQEACGADLIVMGTHGRSGIGHFMLGSVAERVVRAAPVPVLTIRGKSG